MIIGICGFIGCGKDTAADYLVNSYQFTRESFASTLKDAVACVFGWDRGLLEGKTPESRQWREKIDPWWSKRLNIPHLSPRWVLQNWGTDVLRKHFHDDIWVASLENKLRKTTNDVVISDCRFPNEIKAIKNLGGKIVRIVRGSEPEWYHHAVNFNAGPKQLGWAIGRNYLKENNIHLSETAWIGTKFDTVFDNNGTIEQLQQQIKNLVQDQLDAKTTA